MMIAVFCKATWNDQIGRGWCDHNRDGIVMISQVFQQMTLELIVPWRGNDNPEGNAKTNERDSVQKSLPTAAQALLFQHLDGGMKVLHRFLQVVDGRLATNAHVVILLLLHMEPVMARNAYDWQYVDTTYPELNKVS